MGQPLILYSVCTYLAYNIAAKYYGDQHFVWCSPFFSEGSCPSYQYTNPPTSSPARIYQDLEMGVTRDDRHNARIQQNRTGLANGAVMKHRAGVISLSQKKEILAIVQQAATGMFRPLIYVIPFLPVHKIVKQVSVNDRANPLSVEYVIEQLPREHFDIIDFA